MAKRKYPPKHHWSPFPTWTGFLDLQPDFEIEGFDTHFTRGSGTTEHRFLSPNVHVDWGSPPELLMEIEKAAWQILNRAELLTAPEEDYTLPAKRGPWERLLEAMKDREFMDEEWYAVRILTQTSLLRDLVSRFTKSAKTPKEKKLKNPLELANDKKIDKSSAPGIQEIVICAMMLGGQLTEAHRRFGSVKGNSSDAGTARGTQQTEARKSEWAKWQEEAEKVWKKHPRWGKPAVTGAVHEKFPDVPIETIRPRIKKPSL